MNFLSYILLFFITFFYSNSYSNTNFKLDDLVYYIGPTKQINIINKDDRDSCNIMIGYQFKIVDFKNGQAVVQQIYPTETGYLFCAEGDSYHVFVEELSEHKPW